MNSIRIKLPQNETSESDHFKEFDSILSVIIMNMSALQLAESQNNKLFEAFESLIYASSKLIRDSIKYSIQTEIANRIDVLIKKSENYMSQEIGGIVQLGNGIRFRRNRQLL